MNAQIEMIEAYADRLAEHFDSVQIFCTKRPEDGTGDSEAYAHGNGDWYARVGQVHEWCIANDEAVRIHARK